MSYIQIKKASQHDLEEDEEDAAENPSLDKSEPKYIWAHFALILEPPRASPVEFRRIGLAQIPDFEGMTTDGWRKRDTTIV
jgi:hypothetical protein